mmetsp:Transcript_35410/g.111427  ORF Transcript_35410/g.111427 Transcript_35410/m.111427 type:complete len:84 (+) Transcript_35410:144-395(+)|eukprot:CAMPEP_0118887880 /NCGR_PEP_ID=MMETSP1163-20130328/25426_1 /TAXON_ID=124430 /ORGANISM="Phaeomonas parva, Strain CCMP2877" /LENGTH=83 /DNA_ID=CAMNT_0006826415 /DNA_START=114 /DNA_END=365 /DNA_ORIENTATION=+
MVLSSQDAWRRHPLLTKNYRGMFPGLNIALGIFGVYLAVKYTALAINPPDPHAHAHGHGHHGPVKFIKEEIGAIPEPVEDDHH